MAATAATPASSSSSTSSRRDAAVLRRAKSAWPRREGCETRVHAGIAEAIWTETAGSPATGCGSTCRSEPTTSPPPHHPPAVAGLGRCRAVGAGKGGRDVAGRLSRIIVPKGCSPELVGTEPELIEREGVSRALLREAVQAAGASTGRPHAPWTRRWPLRHGAGRQRGDGYGHHLPRPAGRGS